MTSMPKSVYFLLAVLIYLILVIWFWNYSIDDAFVTFRYAENLADGHGLVFNPGGTPVEGYSNFLWLLILSVLYAVGLPTYLTAKILGVLSLLAAGFIWFKYFAGKADSKLWMAPLLFLITPLTAFWAVSGLELGLYAALLAAAVILQWKKSYWSFLFLALITLSRPEGFLMAFILVAVTWFARRAEIKLISRFVLSGLAVVLAAFALLVIFRMIVFGYPMPNTFYAKSPTTLRGFLHLGKMLLYYLPLVLLFLYAVISLFKEKTWRGETVVYAVLFIAQAGISSMANQVMNVHLRYLTPFIPMFLAVAVYGMEKLSNLRLRKIILILSVVSVLTPVWAVNQYVKNEKLIVAAQNDLIKWAKDLPDKTTFSITDAGRIPYYTHKHFYDIWGLTSAEIAHNGFRPLNEFVRFPDYFIFVGYMKTEGFSLKFGTEYLIFKTRDFLTCYNIIGVCRPPGADMYKEGYYYLVFRKNQNAIDSLIQLRQPK